MDNKQDKGGLALIIAEKMKKKDNPPDKSNEELEELAGLIIKAVKDGNEKDLAKNLKSFIGMIS